MRMQLHLTLSSKYFAPFPYGTCLLSELGDQGALHVLYYVVCDPLPRIAILQSCHSCQHMRMPYRNLTLHFILSKDVHARSNSGHISLVQSFCKKFYIQAHFSSFTITWNIICIFVCHDLLICLNLVDSYIPIGLKSFSLAMMFFCQGN